MDDAVHFVFGERGGVTQRLLLLDIIGELAQCL
jgi:hypothetical protein